MPSLEDQLLAQLLLKPYRLSSRQPRVVCHCKSNPASRQTAASTQTLHALARAADHQYFWPKARLKLGGLCALLLLRATGLTELELVSTIGVQLIFLWWFVECFGLLAAASPFAQLF